MHKKAAIAVWGVIALVILALTTYEIIFWFGTPASLIDPDRDNYVTTKDNINLYYSVYGDSGPRIVLLHSGAWSSVEYNGLIQELKQEYVVYAFDLPGFGKSDKPQKRYTIPYITAQMDDAFNQLFANQSIHLVGASAGGTVALQLARQYPGMVQSLTLIDPLGFGEEINQVALWAQIPVLTELVLYPNRPVFDYVMNEGFQWHDAIDEDVRQTLFEESQLPKSSRAKLSILRATMSSNKVDSEIVTTMADAAAHITQPVLLLWGQHDSYAPAAQRLRAKELMPQAVVPELLPTGHFAHIEAPEQVAQQIKQFIQP